MRHLVRPKGMQEPQAYTEGTLRILASRERSWWSFSASCSLFPRFHFQEQRFFSAFPAGDSDKRQAAVDNSGRHGPHGMAIGQFLAVGSRNVHFPIGKTIFHAQLLLEALR